jgi:hypothetical protein
LFNSLGGDTRWVAIGASAGLIAKTKGCIAICPRPQAPASLSGYPVSGLQHRPFAFSARYLESTIAISPVAIDREVIVEAGNARYSEPLHEREAGAVDNGEILIGEGLSDGPGRLEV